MYLIVLCDDEVVELDKAERIIDSYRSKHRELELRIERFVEADEMLDAVRRKTLDPDLILMDIYMPKRLGTEVVGELRDMGVKSQVIFLTTSREHALDAYGLQAVQYLVKPAAEEQVFSIFDQVFERIEEERRKYLLLTTEGCIRRINVSEIAFVDAQGKQQRVHMTCGQVHMVRLSMAELYRILSPYPDFVRVGISYIVNLAHIESLNSQQIQMEGGERIYLPRGSYQPLREQYFRFYCEIR